MATLKECSSPSGLPAVLGRLELESRGTGTCHWDSQVREAAVEEAGSGWVRAQIALVCTYSPALVRASYANVALLKSGFSLTAPGLSWNCLTYLQILYRWVCEWHVFRIQCHGDGASLRCGALTQCTAWTTVCRNPESDIPQTLLYLCHFQFKKKKVKTSLSKHKTGSYTGQALLIHTDKRSVTERSGPTTGSGGKKVI